MLAANALHAVLALLCMEHMARQMMLLWVHVRLKLMLWPGDAAHGYMLLLLCLLRWRMRLRLGRLLHVLRAHGGYMLLLARTLVHWRPAAAGYMLMHVRRQHVGTRGVLGPNIVQLGWHAHCHMWDLLHWPGGPGQLRSLLGKLGNLSMFPRDTILRSRHLRPWCFMRPVSCCCCWSCLQPSS